MAPHSFRVKHGNKTWVNNGQLATTVEQINLAYTPVNRFSKRSINAKTTNSGKSLHQNQLESLVMTSATSTRKAGCVDSPPMWNLGTNSCGCPFPIINGTYDCGVQSYQINYTQGDAHFTITVYYNRCDEGNQSATSTKYKISENPINSNCFLKTPIACSPCNGGNSCDQGNSSSSCSTN
jgi:hypothetical protein